MLEEHCWTALRTMMPNRTAVLFYILTMILMAASRPPTTPGYMTTPVYPGRGTNLRGQMFTLSPYNGGVSLYPPTFNPSSPSPSSTPYRAYWPWDISTEATPLTTTPPPSTPPFSTTPLTTTPPPSTPLTQTPSISTLPSTTLPPSTFPTTASPSGGVSVCVRYMAEGDYGTVFTLSPGSNSYMILSATAGAYTLTLRSGIYYENQVQFQSFRQLWSADSIPFSPWTSVCVTVDSSEGVVQVFRGGAMSIRKILPKPKYQWTGVPVIDLSNIEGQLTDVQVWSSCLNNDAIYTYMTFGYRDDYRGSVLTWFDISYSLRGTALLENSLYAMQNPIGQKAVEPKTGQASESARLEKIMKRLFRRQGRKDRKREWDVSRMRDEGYKIRPSLVLVQ